MVENTAKRTGALSRQTVQLMLDLSRMLRVHGIHIPLAARDIDEQLIQASEGLNDEGIQALRQRLIEASLPATPGSPQVSAKGGMPLPKHSSLGVTTRLQGSYIDDQINDTRSRGIVVEHLSLERLQFRPQSEHQMGLGDHLCVQFMLDDESRTLLWQEVEITEVRDHTIWADFVGQGNAEKVLGPFLEQIQKREDHSFELQLE